MTSYRVILLFVFFLRAGLAHSQDRSAPPGEATKTGSTSGTGRRSSAMRTSIEEQPFYVTGRSVVFGLELNPNYVFTLEPGAGKTVRFTLTHAYAGSHTR